MAIYATSRVFLYLIKVKVLTNHLNSNKLSFAVQYWKFDKSTGYLSNKGNGINQIARIKSVPKASTTDAIIRNDGLALGLVNDDTASGTKVVFEPRDPGATGQLWIRGPKDKDGYFFLRNQKSMKYLTSSTSTDDSIIAGNPITLYIFTLSPLHSR